MIDWQNKKKVVSCKKKKEKKKEAISLLKYFMKTDRVGYLIRNWVDLKMSIIMLIIRKLSNNPFYIYLFFIFKT